MMRVLFIGDSPTTCTGFARVTRAVCHSLVNHGHQVTVIGLHYHGDPHEYPYDIYPGFEPHKNGGDGFGIGRFPYVAAQVRPDLVAILNDPWNVKAYLDSLASHNEKLAAMGHAPIEFPIVGCLAVDARNHGNSGKDLNRLDHIVTWTQFGADELAAGGYHGASTVIPHGTDASIFYPVDRKEARRGVFGASDFDDEFMVGVVGRNQPRKRIDLAIEYFAHWIHTHNVDNASLFLHVAPTGENAVDIRSLTRYHNVRGKVLLNEPHVSLGNDETFMRNLYNSIDVLLSTSQGEGWGLPASEAMACNTPCVLPDFGGFGSWAKGLALLVPCYDHGEITAPIGGRPYTLGAIPQKGACVEILDRVYRWTKYKKDHGESTGVMDLHAPRDLDLDYTVASAVEFVHANSWESVGDQFVSVFESVA